MKQALLTITLILLASLTAQAQTTSVPPLINYQGMLMDANGERLTGMKKLEFSLYDAAAGGNKVWGPQIFSNVPLVNGQFNVILGTTDTAGRSITEAFASGERYLGMKVDDGAEIAPRQQILSAPYAIQATVAETVRGSDLYVAPSNGSVGIGTTSPSPGLKLDVEGKAGAEQYCDDNGNNCAATTDLISSNNVVQNLSNDQVYQNTGKRKLIVVAHCNATLDSKRLEGYIGNSEPDMMTASETGGDRISLTFVVPMGWYYKIHHDSVSGIECTAQAWEM